MSTLLFLGLRALHVLLAAVWIGSTVFVSVLLLPVVETSGPSGGQVMTKINHYMHLYMAVLGVSTVVTGIYLLWRFTGGFDPAVSATHAGMAFSVGGASGILASLVGGGVVGRSGQRVMHIVRQAVDMADGPAKGALMRQAATLRRRMKIGTRFVIALQATAVVLMALGHYI